MLHPGMSLELAIAFAKANPKADLNAESGEDRP